MDIDLGPNSDVAWSDGPEPELDVDLGSSSDHDKTDMELDIDLSSTDDPKWGSSFQGELDVDLGSSSDLDRASGVFSCLGGIGRGISFSWMVRF